MSSQNEKKIDRDANAGPFKTTEIVKTGLEQCYKRLDDIARKSGDAPENTRSNPADRIKRFRENSNWKKEEDKDSVLSSKFYKESAILLFHCVLSPLYGKNVYLTSDSFESLIEKDEIPEGGKYFLKKAREALCEKEEKDGLLIDKEKFIRIYYNDNMIGVFSSSGPIPSICCPFLNKTSEDMFLKKKFKNLDIEALRGTETLLNCFDDNERKLIKLYLDRNKEKIGNCGLFNELRENLKNVDSEIISSSFEMDSSIPFSFPIVRGTGKVVKDKDGKTTTHNVRILADRIVIVPLYEEQSNFGYSIETLKFSLVIKNDETGDDETRWYACIPPLTSDAIDLFNKGKLEFTSISLNKNIERDYKIEGKPIITSLSIECVTTLKNAKSVDICTYTEEKITYIDKFPILYLYGIAPKFGWIARRDIEYDLDFPSPLKNKKKESVKNVRDIALEGITFENSDEKYNYSIYKGKIDEWVAIKNGENYYGALPLRAGRFNETEWQNVPTFVYKNFPEDRVMRVSVDIGSSRSIVLFTDDPDPTIEKNHKSILIENKQELAVSIMGSLDVNSTQDANFARQRFQFNKAIYTVEGKNPLSVILINRETKKDEAISLYKHGKLFFWNPNEITKFNYEGAVVKIKSSLSIKDTENKTNANKAMLIVIQGLLSLIIDRAIRAKCSTIEIRTAYLTEYYKTMNAIWKNALENFKDIIREATIINTQGKNLGDAVKDGNGRLFIKVIPYLPESLAIANKLCRVGFQANSGAAIVDIGDYSTDIAIFKTLGDPTNIELDKNFSIYFGGSAIFLQTIWDYLRKTFVPGQDDLKTRLENIFNLGKFGDDNQKGIDKTILDILEEELKTHREEKKDVEISNDVKSCLLHIIHRLNPSGKDKLLKDLIDLAYLAIMLILKQSISKIGGEGSFDIYLFGGGSFLFKEQMVNEKDEGFDWKGVLNRECGVFNRSSSNDMLAKGLLLDKNDKITETVNKIEDNANNDDKIPDLKFSKDVEELKEAYSKFIERAKKLKKDWSFVRKIENSENFTFLDAEIDENGELIKNNEKLHINESYRKKYDDAVEFAIKCMPKKGDSEIFSQIFRIIFAYKLAYLSVLNDENVMEIKYGSDKNA